MRFNFRTRPPAEEDAPFPPPPPRRPAALYTAADAAPDGPREGREGEGPADAEGGDAKALLRDVLRGAVPIPRRTRSFCGFCRLYRSQCLQENTRFKAFFKFY